MSARRIVATAITLNPKVHIIARTRFLGELESLARPGADEVITEEYETAIQILVRLLRRFLVPLREIESVVAGIRSESYEMLRQPERAGAKIEPGALLPDLEISSFRVAPGSLAQNRTLADLRLRATSGLSVLAVRRGSDLIPNPAADMMILSGDSVIVAGTPAQLALGHRIFEMIEHSEGADE
ncbi:MAG: hypothetical protein KJ621_04790 [Proteobacteria bacterium]|nr:hypothetical protein [Pseudomonadota bacterium]